jgi:hypothetical protein
MIARHAQIPINPDTGTYAGTYVSMFLLGVCIVYCGSLAPALDFAASKLGLSPLMAAFST